MKRNFLLRLLTAFGADIISLWYLTGFNTLRAHSGEKADGSENGLAILLSSSPIYFFLLSFKMLDNLLDLFLSWPYYLLWRVRERKPFFCVSPPSFSIQMIGRSEK
jgi:hypothetical protein